MTLGNQLHIIGNEVSIWHLINLKSFSEHLLTCTVYFEGTVYCLICCIFESTGHPEHMSQLCDWLWSQQDMLCMSLVVKKYGYGRCKDMSDMFHTSTLRIAGRDGQHQKSTPHLSEYMKHRDPVFDTDFKRPCVLCSHSLTVCDWKRGR